ncbi:MULTISPECIES: restriction endonuclease subunit S [Synechococcaceae]|uniref:restriction endonuclease subunit S n=1 Tax=Synechococcaceae TaxID=1890426 RepID=UPI0008FF25C5|nr:MULTISPECIES: restriction endonuclease subunit S [Synechococcaceae]MCT4365133.1 restriction endonuclease subunit S [Candidatus Regnicoccus frigidus MAG-AL1]APD47289.1 hypothetical protein BM449_01940 [Synechococcus sp. SynAce01]MCT0246204.1 restriction endonuclease subunit S [Synechococcus sp. CS-601]MCT4366060.1 restriction endonuclease subunit S [Candidatus Regnicoccus frigidus MAG-AL2]TWB86936.1 type I restriction enzyme S subunit [Synechococcus sp. Ace-Pa]
MSWPSAYLGEVCSFLSGFAFKSDYFSDEPVGLPIIRIRDVLPGTSKTYYSGPYHADYLINNGDILIGMDGEFNRERWKSSAALLNQRVCRTIAKEDVLNNDYLYHALPTILKRIEEETPFVTVKHLSVAKLRSAEIPLPLLEEQRRVAAILDKADELRRKRQRALVCLNQLGQAIFIEMFGDLLVSKEEAVALGEVCDVRDGTHDSPMYVDVGFSLMTSKNFSRGRIDYSGAKLISEADFIDINKRSKVDRGDIIMPMIGTIGGPVVVDFDPDFAIKNVALIKFKNSRMNPEYVRQVLDGKLFKSHVASAGRGGTQKFISLGDIRGFKIPFPRISQQNLFARRVRRLRTELLRHVEAMKAGETFFASLNLRAFRGELTASCQKEATE